jgi:transposase
MRQEVYIGMGTPRYTEEFKKEAVGQILERGYSVREVAERIGVSTHSLYKWIKEDSRNLGSTKADRTHRDLETEVVRLKGELRRVQEERDILKKAAAYFASQSQ